jgi:hypothetical protein
LSTADILPLEHGRHAAKDPASSRCLCPEMHLAFPAPWLLNTAQF